MSYEDERALAREVYSFLGLPSLKLYLGFLRPCELITESSLLFHKALSLEAGGQAPTLSIPYPQEGTTKQVSTTIGLQQCLRANSPTALRSGPSDLQDPTLIWPNTHVMPHLSLCPNYKQKKGTSPKEQGGQNV